MLISRRSLSVGETIPIFDSDRWDVSMATAHDGYPDSNLLTDNLDDVARAWGNRRSQTAIRSSYAVGGSTTFNVDYVAVLGLNRRRPDANLYDAVIITDNQARLIVDSIPVDVYLPAVGSFAFAVTNLTGTYDILNQTLNPPEEALAGGYSPSALVKVSNASNTVVDLSFENTWRSFRPYRTGADLQEILVHARDSVNAASLPTIEVVLRQYVSGSWTTIATLTPAEIEDTSEGFIFRYTWNAVALTNLTDIVGLRITGTTTGTSTPEYLSVVFRAAATGALYDSGWTDIEDSTKMIWAPDLQIIGTEIHTLVEFSDLNAKSVYSLPIPGSPEISVYTAMPEAMTVGRFVAGEAVDVGLRETGFNSHKVGNNQGNLISARGGFLRAQRVDLTRWESIFQCRPQPQSDLFRVLEQIFEDAGFSHPLLFVPDVTDLLTSLWAIITSWESSDLGLQQPDDGSTGDPEPYFELSISAVEANAHATRRID